MHHLFDVSGKTVLVTGGSSGLGLELVRLFLREGARVAAVARAFEPDLADHAGVRLSDNEACMTIESDLTAPGAVEQVFGDMAERFGAPDVVINNAGISIMERAECMTAEQFDEVMRINVNAAFTVAQHACHVMKKRKAGGSIINISSVLADRGIRGSSAYSISKAAMDQMTRSLAIEWGRHRIRVNSIAAGWFASAMSSEVLKGPGGEILRQKNPMRRFAELKDFSGTVLLLASDAGAYVNGAIIPVDGGQSLT